jgi:uncharacterized protein (TIGR03435 family)
MWRIATGLLVTFACLSISGTVVAQSVPEAALPAWQVAAGRKMVFDVASVKPSADQQFRPPAFPLSDDDSFMNTGGHFFADFQLAVYIQFAYKVRLTPEQVQAMLSPLPKWVATDRFAIQASAPGSPTKDQFRLMMQGLLAERFGLKIHSVTRQEKVFAMTMVKPGKPGPKLIPHEAGPACDATVSTDHPVFPERCDVYAMYILPGGLRRIGSRNTTMDLLARSLPYPGNLGRPVLDRSGLEGRFDFTLDFAEVPTATGAGDTVAVPDAPAPTFVTALREQLGLKLESADGPVQTLVVDHVERPSEN